MDPQIVSPRVKITVEYNPVPIKMIHRRAKAPVSRIPLMERAEPSDR
jgi:hypothetical protein